MTKAGPILCLCSKETEIEKIHSNIAIIKNDIGYIKRAIHGNGEPGLADFVRKNNEFRIGWEAKAKLITFFVGGGWGLALFLFVLNWIIS